MSDLDDAADRARRGGVKGLALGSEHLLKVSNDFAPIEEGTLIRSGETSIDDAELKAAVSYDTPYAVVQHEDMSLSHDPGRTAKFLENAANWEKDTLAKIVAQQIRNELGL